VVEEIAPCKANVARYNRLYAEYRQLYPALSSHFNRIARLD
jgi:sugar (pentulose or hexulose) kinase